MAQIKHLDYDGVLYLWQKIKSKFALITHTHAADDIASGTLSVERGGTGKGSVTSGSYLVGNGTGAMTEKTAAQVLSHIGAAASGHTHSNYAPVASPEFSGTPKAPTATAGTNSTQIATTAFVTTAVANAQIGAAMFQDTVDAQSTITNSNYKKGWYWVVSAAGTYVGETCEVGDFIYAIANKGSAYAAADFSVIQRNLDLEPITNAEIDTIVAS